MATRQKQRSEETRKNIVAAAEKLFAAKGYDAVTMREIAKEAGCSHTTIYIYFEDKEALLTQLSMPPLQSLLRQMESVLASGLSPEDKLKAISLQFIAFCLANRSMYTLFLNAKAVRVDEKAPGMELNQLRNTMFAKLAEAVQACLGLEPSDQRSLMYSRIYFYALNGIVTTYTSSEESVEQLMDRLAPTFEQLSEVLIAGCKHKIAFAAQG